MISLLIATLTQSLTLIPLALGISLSYTLLRATDMTIDGSFVLGAAVFCTVSHTGNISRTGIYHCTWLWCNCWDGNCPIAARR